MIERMRDIAIERITHKTHKPRSRLVSLRLPVEVEEALREEAAELTEASAKEIGYQTLAVDVLRLYLQQIGRLPD